LLLQGTSRPRLMRLFSLTTKEEVFRLNGLKPYDSARVAISADGQHVVTTDHDGACSVFDLHTGTLVAKIEIGPLLPDLPAVLSRDGKMAAFMYGAMAVVIEVPTGKRLKEWQFPAPVRGLAFAPDNRHLAIANGNGTIYVMRLAAVPQ